MTYPTLANTKTRFIVQLDKSYGKMSVDYVHIKNDICTILLVPDVNGVLGSMIKTGGWKYETSNIPLRSRKTKFGNTPALVEHMGDGTIRFTTCEPFRPLILRNQKRKKEAPQIVKTPVPVAPSIMKEELLSLRDCVNRVNAIKAEIGDDLVLSIVDGKLRALVEY